MFKPTFTFAIVAALFASLPCHIEAQNVSWSYWADRQGPAREISYTGGNARIRFINIEYVGPSNRNSYRQAFDEAVSHYKSENISYHQGGNGDFFLVSGLSNSTKRIVGWHDDVKGMGGYVVIHSIIGDKVNYETNTGQSWSIGPNPDNYERWQIGYLDNDWEGYDYKAAVQVWKHQGNAGPHAGVACHILLVKR